MIVVADTPPLHYLVLIDRVELLRTLFGSVVVPRAVADELSHPATPDRVRAFIATPPAWIEIRAATASDPSLLRLGRGEAEAIVLAQQLGAGVLLTDDRAARLAAMQRGVKVAGTLGIIDVAAARAIIDLEQTIGDLRRTSFRVSDELIDALRRRHRP